MLRAQVKKLLETTRLYRPVAWTRTLLRDPEAALSAVASALARRLGPPSPGNLSYRLLDRFYLHRPGFRGIRSLFALGVRSIDRLAVNGSATREGPRALVFLLRGHWYGHTLHSYMVGCVLRELGYRVSLVVCSGSVESCGNTRDNEGTPPVPFACKACRKILEAAEGGGFDLINLNDYRTPEEEETVRRVTELSQDELFNYRLGAVHLLGALRPFLMRLYFGDYRQIESGHEGVRNHVRSGVRYLLRYTQLLGALRPSCVCFFNGLFFPEYLFFQETRARGIPSLFLERGMRKNTLFLSLDEPACHYRSNHLWERVKHRIGRDQVEAARAYLAQRMGGPEDPAGVRRDLSDGEEGRYLDLAKRPYVLFFAPVTHDTASMGKGGCTGDVFGTLETLCGLAVTRGKRLVIRSHPDEQAPLNPSRYTVRQYLADHHLLDNDCVVCLDSDVRWNPYTLARYADAIAVYNGTLGMELPSLGHEVFNIADSHYSNKGFTNDVHDLEQLRLMFEVPKQQVSAARREWALKYLYYYVFVANLPVDRLIDEYTPYGYRVVTDALPQERREQLDLIKQRVELLLSLSGTHPPSSERPAEAGALPASGAGQTYRAACQ